MFTPTVLIALALLWQSSPGSLQSVYTSLAGRDCSTVSASAEGAHSVQRCTGVGGYGLLVEDDDARMSATVVAPGGKRYALNYWQVITTGFSSLGEKAEWRVRRQGRRDVPVALIIRVNANEDGEHPEKKTSYLAVAKITPREVCVTDKIGPVPNANVEARRAADTAASRPCLAGQQ